MFWTVSFTESGKSIHYYSLLMPLAYPIFLWTEKIQNLYKTTLRVRAAMNTYRRWEKHMKEPFQSDIPVYSIFLTLRRQVKQQLLHKPTMLDLKWRDIRLRDYTTDFYKALNSTIHLKWIISVWETILRSPTTPTNRTRKTVKNKSSSWNPALLHISVEMKISLFWQLKGLQDKCLIHH